MELSIIQPQVYLVWRHLISGIASLIARWDTGLNNGILIQQQGADVFVLSTLFLNPYNANVVKLLPGSYNALYMSNCASVMGQFNPNGQAHRVLNILEEPYDKIGACSINGGTDAVQGMTMIGVLVDQTNVEGNIVALSAALRDDRFATNPYPMSQAPLPNWLCCDFTLPHQAAAVLYADPWAPALHTAPPCCAAALYELASKRVCWLRVCCR